MAISCDVIITVIADVKTKAVQGMRAYQVCDDHSDDEVGKDEGTDHDAEEEVHSSTVI